MLLKHYLDRGVSKAELSRRFGVNRRTIHNWNDTGQLDRDLAAGARGYTPRPPVAHKLDPYKAIIDARLEAFPKLSAKRLFDEVRAAGYPGGYKRVLDYVRATRHGQCAPARHDGGAPHRPLRARRAGDASPPGHLPLPAPRRPPGSRPGAAAAAGNREGRAATAQCLCGGAAMKAPAPSRRDRLRAMLADLKLPGALDAVDGILSGAHGGTISAAEAIEQLLNAQIVLRNNRRLQTAMRSSRLPAVKTLDQFDFAFQPGIKREQIESLHELGFLDRQENVCQRRSKIGPKGGVKLVHFL